MTVRFFHIPTADLARDFLAEVSVEAEYGSFVLEGTLYTAAHHQKTGPYVGRHVPGHELTGRPSPCNDPAIPVLAFDHAVAVSHLDLDTVGGCLRTMHYFAPLFTGRHQAFWDLAEFVDVSGPHRMDPNHPEADNLLAWWAWLQDNRPKTSRDEVSEVTEWMVMDAGMALHRILVHQHEPMMVAGAAFAARASVLERISYVRHTRVGEYLVVAREASRFVNHLYRLKDGQVADVVVAFNTEYQSVTVSFESPIAGLSCRALVQDLWGPEAGGHDGIAGSPRGQVMTTMHRDELFHEIVEYFGSDLDPLAEG